ncbi:MAG: ribonuclease HIII [Lentisphaerae bacterium]|nr:ribonuclease HIII [Lentisphaerota bacterium]
MPAKTSFTYPLDAAQQEALLRILKTGNYFPIEVEHALFAARKPDCTIVLYRKGKCLVQGKGAEDFIRFVLEPEVLGQATLGYETEIDPDLTAPHIGVDESGKGDFFGPLVIAAAYVDPDLYTAMQELNVRDSKRITTDKAARTLGSRLRALLGRRMAVVKIGPRAYNRLYSSMRSVNRILAWGHARAIENLLEAVPDCTRAVSDQFGAKHQVERALMQKGKRIELVQRHKAESDMAVAAASVIAREQFLVSLEEMSKSTGVSIPKGASAAVRQAAAQLAETRGPEILLDTVKCHFKTTDEALASIGKTRAALGQIGQAKSQPRVPYRKPAPGSPEQA